VILFKILAKVLVIHFVIFISKNKTKHTLRKNRSLQKFYICTS